MSLNTVLKVLVEPVYWINLECFECVVCVTCRYCLIFSVAFCHVFSYYYMYGYIFVCIY